MGISVAGKPNSAEDYTGSLKDQESRGQWRRESQCFSRQAALPPSSSCSTLPSTTLHSNVDTGGSTQQSQVAAGSAEDSPEKELVYPKPTVSSAGTSPRTLCSLNEAKPNMHILHQGTTSAPGTNAMQEPNRYGGLKTHSLPPSGEHLVAYSTFDPPERYVPVYGDNAKETIYQPEEYFRKMYGAVATERFMPTSPRGSVSDGCYMPGYPSYSHYIVPTDQTRAPMYQYPMPHVVWGTGAASGSSHYSRAPGIPFAYSLAPTDRLVYPNMAVAEGLRLQLPHVHGRDVEATSGGPPISTKENVPSVSKRRAIKRRTRTGCLTCRKRRIKCDEQKPHCFNCQRSRKLCLGYENLNNNPFQPEKAKEPVSAQQ